MYFEESSSSKLSDFGEADNLHNIKHINSYYYMFEKRNPFYFSPELLNIYLRKNPNYINLKKSDVFAYGVMAFEAFFDGLTPFLYPM